MRGFIILSVFMGVVLVWGAIGLFFNPKEEALSVSDKIASGMKIQETSQEKSDKPEQESGVMPMNKPESEMTDTEKRMNRIGIWGLIEPGVFEYALFGLEHFDAARKDVLTIVDFSKPSTEERLFTIDPINDTLLIRSYVSHGEGSGEEYAIMFSNIPHSHQSSLGFYVTLNTYRGKNGYSMVVDGVEKGINEQARWRGIVVHGADYANPSVIDSLGYLGMSEGCLALPFSLSTQYIDAVKNGSLILVYAHDELYLSKSKAIEAFQKKIENKRNNPEK